MDRSNKKDTRSTQRGKSHSKNESIGAVELGYPDMTPTPRRFGAAAPSAGAKSNAGANPNIPNASQGSRASSVGSNASRPPLPKRPKGRLFLGGLLLLLVCYTSTFIYDSFLRYAAYGEVTGRHIQLAAPWEGVVSMLHVREGDSVRQGDPTFQVDSLAMRHRLEEIEDNLHLERSRLAADLAKLKWDAERMEDEQELVKADYYEKWSELLWEQSVLADLAQKLSRNEKLGERQ